MTCINRLRKWYADPQIASAIFKEAAFWTHDRPERPALDKARDAVAMLASFVGLTETAMMFRGEDDEESDMNEQVAIEAAQLALQYCEELLRMAHANKNDRESLVKVAS